MVVTALVGSTMRVQPLDQHGTQAPVADDAVLGSPLQEDFYSVVLDSLSVSGRLESGSRVLAAVLVLALLQTIFTPAYDKATTVVDKSLEGEMRCCDGLRRARHI